MNGKRLICGLLVYKENYGRRKLYRNILPYHNYQSGYRAGRAAMRRLALEAFDKWLQENEETFTADKADEARAAFQLLIRD